MKTNLVSRLVPCFAALSIAAAAFCGGNPSADAIARAVHPVDITPDSSQLLATNGIGSGLHLVDTISQKSHRISANATAGYGASISPDGKMVAFKSIDPVTRAQSPALYDISTGKITLLATAPLAGTPSINAAGTIAFTVGNELRIQDASGNVIASYDLGHHVNLVALSDNGASAAYNDENDQIVVINLRKGTRKIVTDGKANYFNPKFSPNGKLLLVQTISGEIGIAKIARAKVRIIGAGDSPAWLDNSTVSFTMKSSLDGLEVSDTALVAVSTGGKVKGVLASTSGDASAVAHGTALAFSPNAQNTPRGLVAAAAVSDDLAPISAELQVGLTSKGLAWTQPVSVQLEDSAIPESRVKTRPADDSPTAATAAALSTTGAPAVAKAVVDSGSYVSLTNVPYIHQNDDSPDWWNGNSSCSATAALIAMQYYNILPKHPMTCTWPSPHNSDYGWYIANNYTFNGHTYNKPSYDPNGTTGYGGFGYITQNGWEDTKGHMAEYITYHGATSSVDWSPTIAEARSEIDANHPFVLLNSLTSAGHYIVCIGYVKNQHTLIFNDPYGNKNSGYYPSANGQGVWYDWPGYNNGYSNLNVVHCYIWCRKSVASPPTITVDNTSSGFSCSSTWATGTSAADKYGTNYRYRSTQSISDAATWSFNITQAGSYKVQVWYSQGSNRSATAPYILPNGNSVSVNQQTGGGAWQTIGTLNLSTGTNTVKLSCWTTAGSVVIADAIRVVPQF